MTPVEHAWGVPHLPRGTLLRVIELRGRRVSWREIETTLDVPLQQAYAEFLRHREGFPAEIPRLSGLEATRRARQPETQIDIARDCLLPVQRVLVALMHRVSLSSVNHVVRERAIVRSDEDLRAVRSMVHLMATDGTHSDGWRARRHASATRALHERTATRSVAVPAPRVDHFDLARRHAAGEFDFCELQRRLRGHAPSAPISTQSTTSDAP